MFCTTRRGAFVSLLLYCSCLRQSQALLGCNQGRTRAAPQKYQRLLATHPEADHEPTVFGFPQITVAQPLGVLLLSQFLLFIGVGAVIPSLPLYGKEIGLSGAANGIVLSAPAVALVLGAKWGGQWADSGRKPAMLVGMAVIAVSDLGTALASSVLPLILARLGLGAGRCISEAGERGLLADLAKRVPSQRGRILAWQQAAVALGITIGAPIGGLVIERYGPRASFLCVSAAAIVTFGFYIFLPETVVMKREDSRKAHAAEQEGSWSELLKHNSWRGVALCQCGSSFGLAAKISSIPVLAANVLPGGALGAGALLSAAGLTGIVGAPIGGWLTDATSAKQTAMVSGIISSAGLILVPVALSLEKSDSTLVAGVGLPAVAFTSAVLAWSLGASAQGPALTALAQELAPFGAEATALALPRATGDGAYIAAPFLLGLVADTKLYTGLENAVAGFAILLGVFSLYLLVEEDTQK